MIYRPTSEILDLDLNRKSQIRRVCLGGCDGGRVLRVCEKVHQLKSERRSGRSDAGGGRRGAGLLGTAARAVEFAGRMDIEISRR